MLINRCRLTCYGLMVFHPLLFCTFLSLEPCPSGHHVLTVAARDLKYFFYI